MFTAINNIWADAPRHAERTDTRQALQRHDPDQQGRRKHNGASKDEEPNHENTTTISIEALKTFLDTLLESKGSTPPPHTQTTQPQPEDYKIQQELDLGTTPENAPRTSSATAARAASLYKAASSAIKYNSLLKTTDTASSAPEINLNSADLITIHTIRNDLETLSHNNIKYLQIQHGKNFLNSLFTAIETAKHTI